jgi:hypothetical protein
MTDWNEYARYHIDRLKGPAGEAACRSLIEAIPCETPLKNWFRPVGIYVILPARSILECTFGVRGRILCEEELCVFFGGEAGRI